MNGLREAYGNRTAIRVIVSSGASEYFVCAVAALTNKGRRR